MMEEDLQYVEQGLLGLNKGIPTGIGKFDSMFGGIQRGIYYLLGAGTGSGKTAFIDNMLLNGIEANMDIEVIYFSLEITKKMKLFKAYCRKIRSITNVAVDTNFLLSVGDKKITQEYIDLLKTFGPYKQSILDKVHFYDDKVTPEAIYKIVKDHLDPQFTKTITDKGTVYTPINPNKYILIVIDHIGLIKGKGSKKERIDTVSDYMVYFRNKYGVTPILISQFNRSTDNPERRKQENQEPLLSDFKESGNPSEDSNMTLSLFSPKRYKMSNYYGYNVNQLDDRIKGLYILKNRDGISDVVIPMYFIGQTGEFFQMPEIEKMTPDMYNKLTQIKTL